MAERVEFRNLGRMPYQQAWDLQEALLSENVRIKQSAPRDMLPREVPTRHYLLFCEHPPVYTLGKSGKESHLLISEERRRELGVEYFRINRGGDITYHGPGQITGYPILDLEKFRTDLTWYLRSLEEVMICLLRDFGLEGGRLPGATGVWLDAGGENPRKICAMGVRCSRWVTMHGFALNVNTDLSYFGHIVPCGIDDKGVSSLAAELGRPVEMELVQERLRHYFSVQFGADLIA